jgi:hypothetical protein
MAAHLLAHSSEFSVSSVWRGVSPNCIRETICTDFMSRWLIKLTRSLKTRLNSLIRPCVQRVSVCTYLKVSAYVMCFTKKIILYLLFAKESYFTYLLLLGTRSCANYKRDRMDLSRTGYIKSSEGIPLFISQDVCAEVNSVVLTDMMSW